MNSRTSHRSMWHVALVSLLVVLVSAGDLATAQRQPEPTEDDGPPIIATLPPQRPTPEPTRPPRPTPTPVPTTPPRPTAVPTTPPRPTAVPTEVPLPTVNPPDPQPAPPDLPDTQPTPTSTPSFLPGTNNRFEITLYTCPAGIDPAGDEAALLAACPIYMEIPPPDNIHFQMGDGVQQHSVGDLGHDGTFVFDTMSIIPGPLLFIVEEFNPGYGDPAVFCSEGGAAHARMPTSFRVIRPDLSTFSNVDYTCAWFKIPLQGDTVRVFGLGCIPGASGNEPFHWYWQNCRSNQAVTFELTDANGTRIEETTDGEVIWSGVAFGRQNQVTVRLLEWPAALGSFRVFCGDFNSGVEQLDDLVTITRSNDAPPVEYVCRWFFYGDGPTSDHNLQIPATLKVTTRLCPRGQDPAASVTSLVQACDGSGAGIDVAMIYPGGGGMLAILTTPNTTPSAVTFGLIGEGYGAVVADNPPGYAPVVYCTVTGVSGATQHATTTVTLGFAWGSQHACTWFYIPTPAGAADPPSAAGPGFGDSAMPAARTTAKRAGSTAGPAWATTVRRPTATRRTPHARRASTESAHVNDIRNVTDRSGRAGT